MSFPLNFKNKYYIDTDKTNTTPVWAALAAGIATVDPSFEDETDDTAYYDGEGFGNEEVTGVRASLAFSGHRDYDDAGQNFIAGMAFEVGDARKSKLKWVQPDGTEIIGPVTISNIKTTGGDANSKQEFEFTATFNGKPALTPPNALIAPTVPTGLASADLLATSVTLNWTPSTGSEAIEYVVYKDGVQEAVVSSATAAITGLTTATTYQFTVEARYVSAPAVKSALSAPLEVITP